MDRQIILTIVLVAVVAFVVAQDSGLGGAGYLGNLGGATGPGYLGAANQGYGLQGGNLGYGLGGAYGLGGISSIIAQLNALGPQGRVLANQLITQSGYLTQNGLYGQNGLVGQNSFLPGAGLAPTAPRATIG